MKELELFLGSAVTSAVLAFAFALVRARRKVELPAYWLGLISALPWFPALISSWLGPALRKEPRMAIGDWVIATVFILAVTGFWSLACSIPARMAGAAYERLRDKRNRKRLPSSE